MGFVGSNYVENNYKTEKYYEKVNEPQKTDQGYKYHMIGYNIKGDKKEIELNVDREKPLKKMLI
ncbi:DUF1093 domain-containing protein [Clostridium botulinum]|nr:DUF1093 domain-containing protein [Clostridium botulinum]MBY6814550.1 DUF1093 domain-containing protein [Clostridium botulinum]MBY6821093.1 DUF1093 domain-containing protein [Clostridium botulinum]NFJ50239.1 DUF1093 domain-containing protein [Clostridium botulinum]NFL07623.1 DUF1093 domain-containing protein [Clostridium botulinum]